MGQFEFARNFQTVGAVYDRTHFATREEKRAVIDRTYNLKMVLDFKLTHQRGPSIFDFGLGQ